MIEKVNKLKNKKIIILPLVHVKWWIVRTIVQNNNGKLPLKFILKCFS